MGKGDQRSRRGKIWKGTYGKTRPHARKAAPTVSAQTEKKTKAAK